MLVPLWTLLSITTTWAQNVQPVGEGARFEWGWSLQSPDSPATTGQYYVRLPQAEQRVSYTADDSGYHTAVAVHTGGEHHSHRATFALGDQALRLLRDQESQLQQSPQQPDVANTSSDLLLNANEHPQLPLDIYLLQQQYSPLQNQQFVQIHNPEPNLALQYGIPNYYKAKPNENPPPYYVVHHDEKPKDSKAKEVIDISNGPAPVLQVFKHLNCTEEDTSEKTTKLFERPLRKDINGDFGAKTLKYKGTVNFRVEPDGRQNARSERVYMAEATTARSLTDDEGISKLVASTQDLITNDDLLTINHAFEKSYVHNDDIIKPANRNVKAEPSIRYEFVQAVPQNEFTVRTKLGNIISQVQNLENNKPKEQIYQDSNQFSFQNPTPTDSYQHSFTSPIIVKDSTDEDFKEQVVNNIVSTVSPYLDEGYEVASIRNTLDDSLNRFIHMQQSKDYEDSTSRPISQNYLAPITVGLRLLNANDSEIFNTVDGDHEGSDTELVAETIKSPVREKTVVEIQESIPLEITHINDVEHHEYLEDGRSNDNTPLDAATSLYNRFVQALESSRKIQENMNEQLYKSMTHGVENVEEGKHFNDSEDTLEPSANIQTEVEIRPDNDSSNERREFVRLHHRGRNFIQPIVIEKEVPVTKYVDRVVEKPVPYPERVEVVKEVDKHIFLPVPIQKIVDRPVEVTRYVDKPYPIHVPQPYPVEIKIPYPIEKQVFVDRPVHVPYTVEKVVEKVHPVAVPTPVAIPVEVPVEKKVFYPVTVDKHIAVPIPVEKKVPYETIVEKKVPVPYPVEKRVPYPVPYETKVPYPVEKRIEVPVDRIVEKPVTITKYVDKPYRVEVPVPQPVPYPVRYPQPYPVDRIVEKKVPYPVQVDRIVEKRVPYQVPYPVEKIVEKVVEKPVVVTKYVNKPYPVETKVPYPVETIVEKKVPYPVKVPIEVKVPYPVERIVERPVHVPFKVPYAVEKLIPVFYSSQSQNLPQKVNPPRNIYEAKYQHFLREKNRENAQQQEENQESRPEVQSTRWGNHYASSYQYINNTAHHGEFKRTPSLANYLNYVTNNNMNRYQYYGPPPTRHSEDSWGRNSQEQSREQRLRRTDRTSKMTNLRIEYGFKPPLVPSTEVDLDGVPVNRVAQN